MDTHKIGSSYYYAIHNYENYLNLTKLGPKLKQLFKIDYDYYTPIK